jgi:hypothetical protein
MKRLIITEEEKQRILEMHESATKKNYLTEKVVPYSSMKQAKPAVPYASVEANEFGLNNKNAKQFMELARASTQFIFNNSYYVLSHRGELRKEPMNWNETGLTWDVYGIGIQLGYPYIQQLSPLNTVSVYNVEGATGDVNGNYTEKCNVKFKNTKKQFGGVNEVTQYLGGPINALNYFVTMLNTKLPNGESLNLTKFAPLIDSMASQPNYDAAFKKLWLPTLTPNNYVSAKDITTIQNNWFYKTWLKNKYGSQPTGTQPTGTTPAR